MADHSYNALYYPFIHFKNDSWVKAAALYWDRLGRIVPSTYQTEDSDTVRSLGDFIETLRPEWVRPEFGETFVEFAREHGLALRGRFGVDLRDQWPELPMAQRPPAAGGLSGTDPRLSYVFYEKMTPILRDLLVDSGIALPDQGDPRWVGMHPRLAHVYMTALADELAGERGLYPLTDETLDHLAVGGWTVERLAQALFGDIELAPAERQPREVEGCTAYVALQTVLPRNLDELPVDRILEFRAKYPGERAAFQQYISEFLKPREWLAEIKDPAVLERRLQTEFEKELRPRMDEFRDKLRDVNIDTIWGALAIQVAVPSILAQGAALLGVAVNPIGGILAGAALALIPVLRDRRKAKRELRSSPVAYLQRVEKDLKPHQLAGWIWQGSQAFKVSR
jgi:hypothetical protein